jgi:hypothetical protein
MDSAIAGVSMIRWTEGQLEEIARQYERIGYRRGELWPAPPEHLTGDQIIALMKEVPDRGGLEGWRAVLAKAK